MNEAKQAVREFWNQAACGENLYLADTEMASYAAQAQTRYALEPYIRDFARFEETRGLRVLEIGVGLGADHQQFAEAGADLWGIDLTERAIEHTRRRLSVFGLTSHLAMGDAEHLDFPDESFDRVYAWGVLHHSPDTPRAIAEVWRVLKHGGEARIMIYHKHSVVGFMLWLRYGLLVGRPWRSWADLYAHHLESPGTKAYTIAEARQLCAYFAQCHITTVLTHGDLLTSAAGQRHRGPLLTVARKLWPRWLIRRFFPGNGLFMLIAAVK
ncbi:MAG: class I SAM-dependent methyltransferase [Candidatus Contendobacter sp.]|nr:class I SAM-dependent methyltransferase [Candidatus Contendobacter sp.]MDG4558535.1 class I SAM-dependent methyltransferase [Candidatus Contendobacter sp.]